jgi:Arrestin (or S-antigen), C-terminal domain
MVNYNITYQNQSYRSFFSLQTAVVRATGSTPEFTNVYPIEFMPFVATSLHKEVHTEAKGADHVMGEIIMPETGFLAGETATFQLRLTPNGPCAHNKIVSVQAKLKQIISIGYDGYFRMERNDISTTKATAPQSLPETLSMELCIPKTALPSIAYSVHMKTIYQLYVTVHLKSNTLFRHKIKFAVPITIGTLGRGISPPRELLSYTDREVVCENGMRFKPRFLLNEQICDEDNLPPYDDCSPPTYQQMLEA